MLNMSKTTPLLQTLRSFSGYRSISNVSIIGGGLMGSGIAQVAAAAGNDVNVIEVNDKALEKSKAIITKSLERVAKNKFKDDPSKAASYAPSILKKISFTQDLGVVKGSGLVLEAIVENLVAKQKLFKEVELLTTDTTILASNTSSIQIKDIALHSNRKDKFAGLHFFNPVPMMKLLEVISTQETSQDTYRKLMNWGQSIGKVCVTCKDTPGFIVNRLLVPYLVQGVLMYERGDASTTDIDIAMKLGAGYPMGPFELADYVGLDVILFILQGWVKNHPDNASFVVPKTLEKLVQEGKLGVKSGSGFYNYDKKGK
ncbi:probable 3-hydroxyacyl-CoA dehydrogenase B0272.3 [Folsomia candida]|uniref:3-hydroxyacyl-CoA dehydrogenase n=1 Tax=Folsomia candida TaxID=158441 RepID=A0A226EJI9_FOLCA|nr:probable 3-hydroxyacyl-CoA dehydrogenase B0272.3 [Folsomia candida]OXA57368.1 Hydroxyacyl-coenzyme A dehydrogenase, mitochondrial [Folsomia candida]